MLNKKIINVVLVLALAIIIALSVFYDPQYILVALGLILAIIFFARNLKWGIYLMTALYPFIYLQVYLGSEINIPYVDLIALLVFMAWICKKIYWHISGKQKIVRQDFFGLGVFIPFFIVSLLSLINVDSLAIGFKYFLRPIVFFYLMFVVLPYNVIDSKKVLDNIFKILLGVGVFVSLMGLYSLLFGTATGGFSRAVPISIFGINPLGTNHNLISEVLISVIPVAMILVWQEKNFKTKKLLILALVTMMLVNLLTFSRTGWIALFLEIIILLGVYFKNSLKKIAPIILLVALLFLPVVFMMFGFLDTAIVESSNANRIRLTQIAWQSFEEHPVLGSGIGTFIEKVSADEWYILDFGIPLEAHGVVQKLIAETGVLGFVTFFFMLGYLILFLIKVYRILPRSSEWKFVMICMILSVVGSVIFQLFNTSYFVSKMWLPIGIALSTAKLALNDYAETKN